MIWGTVLEIVVLVYFVGMLFYMKKKGYTNITRKILVLAIGVLLFELMSEPMWLNIGFDSWAYLYKDITWIITLGWVSIFMTSFMLIDFHYGYISEKKRFWLYLFLIQVITVPLETFLLQTGIRKYAPVLVETMTGKVLPLTVVPVEAIYAIPLFSALILCFYKYINYTFEVKADA